MSSYNINDDDKKVGIGHILRTINNQQILRNDALLGEQSDKYKIITIKHLQENSEISQSQERVDLVCREMNMLCHGKIHAQYVAKTCGDILKSLNYDTRDVHLGEISGYMHDLGYILDVEKHAFISAGMAYEILKGYNMQQEEIDKVCLAIAHHESQKPVNVIGAVLLIAGISDFNKDRVRENTKKDNLIQLMKRCISHRINASERDKTITLEVKINFDKSVELEDFIEIMKEKYFQCCNVARFLGCRFYVRLNEQLVDFV